MKSLVNHIPAATSSAVLRYCSEKLRVEIDCWSVNESLRAGADFVVVDVRGPVEFALGHVPSAVNFPSDSISDVRFPRSPKGATFVVYGAGPHCNRADRAAIQLAHLDLPVKIMIGGFSGWREEGFRIETSPSAD